MQVVTEDFVKDKIVLLRLDIDVPLEDGRIVEDYRLQAAIPTLHLCLKHAAQVIVMGHIGRPGGKEVPELSVEPIVNWLAEHGFTDELESEQLDLLENLRFEPGEDAADPKYAHQLARIGDVYVNEAFASHRPAASTTVLPHLLPHAAGLRFAQEVEILTNLRQNPKKPLFGIIGGAKTEDKYPAVLGFAKFCDKVLVGGLLAKKIKDENLTIPDNVVLGVVEGFDMSYHTINHFKDLLKDAQQVIWAGPLGKYEDPSGNKCTTEIAEALINAQIEVIIGGGDTQAALSKYLDKFHFVSTGGGAMLKLLQEGTLPTIEALR